MKKAYSLNDEDYLYDSVGDLLDYLESEGNLVEGTTYYESDIKEVNLADYFNVDSILECAEERLADDIGEHAFGVFGATQSARTELYNLMRSWTEKYLSKECWKCVGKAREYQVSQTDLEKYNN